MTQASAVLTAGGRRSGEARAAQQCAIHVAKVQQVIARKIAMNMTAQIAHDAADGASGLATGFHVALLCGAGVEAPMFRPLPRIAIPVTAAICYVAPPENRQRLMHGRREACLTADCRGTCRAMTILPFEPLTCPLDGAPLQRKGMAMCCASGHSFDVASQGYVNLLPVQNKRSLDPGDSKEMVAARRRFLGAGHYAPIAEAVSRSVLAATPADQPLACLDAGCGEGYYLRQLESAALAEGRRMQVLGLDISKWAVLAAAKLDRQAAWVVGSNASLPMLPASLDCILCMFGFPVHAEFARVLRPGAYLLQVDAGPDHLRELREVIYPSLKAPRAESSQAPAGFEAAGQESLGFTVRVEGAQAIADLLAMTPHLYRATAEGRARAAALTGITLSVDVRLAGWRRLG